MSAPRLQFLDWRQPLLTSAAAWLAHAWDGRGPLDLADQIVIVPTRQAGRRLREALAGLAAERSQAVFPPKILLPEGLLEQFLPASGAATRLESTLAWIETLRASPLSEYTEVFPTPPEERSFGWALRLARQFLRVQSVLGETGLRMADVAARAGAGLPERERWRQLAALEQRCDAALAARGWRDRQAARIEAAGAGEPPAGVRRIVLIGAPDPMPLALVALERLARTCDVVVATAAPPDESAAALFDAWGRPRAEHWAHRPLAWRDFAARVHLCADPAAQAAHLARLVAACEAPEGRLALAIADPAVIAPLRHELARAGRATFDPEGEPRRHTPLHELVRLLADLARDPDFATVAALARCPDVLAWLRSRIGGGFSAARALAELDEIHARHLPATLAVAREAAQARCHDPARPSWRTAADTLDALHELHGILRAADFPENIRAALALIFSGQRFDLAHAGQAAAVESAGAWMECLRAAGAAVAQFRGVSPADAWELALAEYGELRRFDEKPAGAIELQGWLEVLWENAPQLVIAGVNEGRAPAAIVGDPFLPESLRELLGLRTNAERFAVDAYVLAAAAAARDVRGRLEVAYGKYSERGDPLRPSRLLLQCADDELPDRVALLFREPTKNDAYLPWRRAWRLAPRADATIDRLRVTAFRDYLRCPFRFYLRHGLQMKEVDPHKAELDAFDFGNLCHAALERLGRDEGMRECTDANVLRDFLLAELERRARADFGADLPLPLLVQLESARQRLARAAGVQAAERAAGWRIERVEWKFLLEIGGRPISGTIDRIDRHEQTGELRVLDYKTSDRPVDPRAAHLRTPRRREDPAATPDFAWLDAAGDAALVWKDLQLPLYRRALAAEPGRIAACGYFNLPKAASETAVSWWHEYDADLQASADRCAEGVVAAVQARRFWPPAELPAREDDFAALFHQGAAESVMWSETETEEDQTQRTLR